MDATRLVESETLQLTAVLAATLVIAALHWTNDGLWFQGDAPRHAVTGLLFRDLLVTWPADPLAYALGYFARYPALVLGAYPPVFHLIEGLVFAVAGPSPYAAKALVLASAAALGGYTAWWGRRFIAPVAGWAGACVVLTPALVELGNAVLLNVPAAALGMAALYHAQAWLDTESRSARWRFVLFGAAATATYLPGAIVLPMAATWIVLSGSATRLRSVVVPAIVLGVAVAATAIALPDHFARQGPGIARLVDPEGWRYYANAVPHAVGAVWFALGTLGLVVGLAAPGLRVVAGRVAIALAAGLVCLVLLPAQDLRYATMAAPLFVLAGFTGIVGALRMARAASAVLVPAVVAVVLALSIRGAATTPLMHVEGIDAVAAFLREIGPGDSVLYSGVYDGVFTFYVRALDPSFERRVVLANRLLAEQRQEENFEWTETLKVRSAADVVARVRGDCGCQFLAIERGGAWITAADRLLSDAAAGADFTRLRSFPVRAGAVTSIDVYRVGGRVSPPPPMDLSFPSYTARVFRGVVPVPTRR